MKIDIQNIDRNNFMVHEHVIAGEICFLVQPVHIGCKWEKNNLIFRSSVWNSDGEPVSLGFKKFFNFGEQPDLCYTPFSLTANGGCSLMEKLDGSTLIVSCYHGQLITRTRGTVDATKLDNGFEIEVLKKKYPNAFNFEYVNKSPYSFIYEWVSPTNKIVLDYGPEPDLYLTAIINHQDYSLLPQSIVDKVAIELQVKRPKRYSFNSVKEMLIAVEAFQGVEGICVYCNKDQDIRKVKSAQYLAKHRFKENATLENTVDLFVSFNYPDFPSFEQKLIATFDYECYEMVRGFASRICEGHKEVALIVDAMINFAQDAKKLSTRKLVAEKVLQAYGNTNRASFVFKLFDGKNLDTEDIKKLLYQVLKK